MKNFCFVFIVTLLLVGCQRNTTSNTTKATTYKEDNSLWESVVIKDADHLQKSLQNYDTLPIKYHIFRLNHLKLYQLFHKTPKRTEENASQNALSISFPNLFGMLTPFKIWETTIMEKALAEKYPELRTYEGQSMLQGETIRVSRNDRGIDAMVLSPSGTYYIDPILLDEQIFYIIYLKEDYTSHKKNRFYEVQKKQ